MKIVQKDAKPEQLEEHWHLAHTEMGRSLAEFEHALICLCEAFGRYNLQGLATVVGDSSFSGQDNSVLHVISTLGRPKGISDISRFMNRDDLVDADRKLTI